MEIMQHDVRRLDRDIGESRTRAASTPRWRTAIRRRWMLAQLARAVVSMLADSPRSRGVALKLKVEPSPDGGRPDDFVMGHDSRLAQV